MTPSLLTPPTAQPPAEPNSASATAPPAITLRGLTRRFRSRTVVDHIDLDVPAGSTTALIGLNGAGKSTAIRMMVGLLPPSSGSIVIRGHDVQIDPIAAKSIIGYVPDRPTAYPWMTVRQVLDFSQALRPTWNVAYAADLLKLFRLDPTQKVKRLSKGQAAKLSLLVAVAPRPPILILDEPTDGMDPLARDEFLDGVLRTIVDGGQTVLISSHALDEVQRLADRIVIMHEGRIVHIASTDELVSSTKRIRATLPDQHPLLIPPPGTIWHRTDRREWLITVRDYTPHTLAHLNTQNTLTSVEVFDLSLDDIFKDLIRGLSTAAPTPPPVSPEATA